jgi:hypothetical protein
MTVQLKIPSEILRDAADTVSKLSGLVPAAEGQLSTLYVLLCASVQHQKAYIEFNRNGLRVRCSLGRIAVSSPVPQAAGSSIPAHGTIGKPRHSGRSVRSCLWNART